MAKSVAGFLTLQKLIDAGYNPFHYRYLCLSAHYRGELRFSFDSLDGARQAYDTLCHKADEWRALPEGALSAAAKETIKKIDAAMADDLNSPVALSVLWEAMRDEKLLPSDKLAILDAADSALGLGGVTLQRPQLTAEQEAQILLRENLRREKKWKESDEVRASLAASGVMLKDRPEGTTYYKKEK